jgi:hypothetical protein
MIFNKKIRKQLLRGFSKVRMRVPGKVSEDARLKNLDMLLNILKERQKEAKKKITKEFDELISIGYIGVLIFGYLAFALTLDDDSQNIFPKNWISEDSRPDPNDIIGFSFGTISHESHGVLKLVESGLEGPARSLMRILLEHCCLALVLCSDKERLLLYNRAQGPEDARDIWNKYLRPKTISADLKLIEKRLSIHEEFHEVREDLYTLYTQFAHNSAIANLFGSVLTPIKDHNMVHSATYGYASATSVVPLMDLCATLIYTYTTFFRIMQEIHHFRIPRHGEHMPFLYAMLLPFNQLLQTVSKYDGYLKMELP